MIWVLDTCALSEPRRIERISKKKEGAVFDGLTALVTSDVVVFPRQVVDELSERGYDDEHFRPYHWADEHKKHACRFGHLFEEQAEVLAHNQIRRICDWEQSKGTDPADPHILALAMHLRKSGQEVTVVSEDRVDKPKKLSVATGCGLLQVYWLRMEPFLIDRGLLLPVDAGPLGRSAPTGTT